MLSACCHFVSGGINNFTEPFIERLIAGISHGSVVVRTMLQRQTQVFGGISKGLVTTTSVSASGLFAGRPPWPRSSYVGSARSLEASCLWLSRPTQPCMLTTI